MDNEVAMLKLTGSIGILSKFDIQLYVLSKTAFE
jgi:hypothetical protein